MSSYFQEGESFIESHLHLQHVGDYLSGSYIQANVNVVILQMSTQDRNMPLKLQSKHTTLWTRQKTPLVSLGGIFQVSVKWVLEKHVECLLNCIRFQTMSEKCPLWFFSVGHGKNPGDENIPLWKPINVCLDSDFIPGLIWCRFAKDSRFKYFNKEGEEREREGKTGEIHITVKIFLQSIITNPFKIKNKKKKEKRKKRKKRWT